MKLPGRALIAGCVCAGTLAADAAAQPTVLASVERLSFDRPEAWAMKYFTSTTLVAGIDADEETRAGSVTIGVESGWLPRLTTAQQRVGYYGMMLQDLNQTPLVVRPRVRVGLPRGMAVAIAVAPPVRSFDVTPRLAAASLEGPLAGGDAWRLRWRTYGQIGTVRSAVTCSADMAAFPAGSPNNRLGCEAESADVASLRYAGGELRLAGRIGGATPHVAAGVNLIDAAFQTDARTFGYLDRSRLETRGVTFSTSAGVGFPLADRMRMGMDVFYSPLMVRRTFNAPRSNDGLLTGRVTVSYRLR